MAIIGQATRSPAKDETYDNWLISDWAGRDLLAQYLYGDGKALTITYEQKWTTYLTASTGFTSQVKKYLMDYSAFLVTQNKGSTYQLNLSKSASFQNGEAATGYNYLHGAAVEVGQFQILGNASAKRGSTTTEIFLNPYYIWNDFMNAEIAQYGTDALKNQIAKIITLGRAKPYVLKIQWDVQPPITLTFDNKGVLIKKNSGGWPF
jgi:hypothetical protein